MIRAVLIACLAACVFAQDISDATSACYTVQGRRNQKDLYADSTNCHNYIQCFYFNETLAVGFRRHCPQGTFWHDAVLTCMPEGATPCVDRCLEDATSTRGCYAGLGCRQFFVCANTGSYGMCCPLGTSFNEATCSCDENPVCADSCVQTAPPVPTTAAPATSFNGTVCKDSFGVYIAADAAEVNAYHLIDEEGHSSGKQYCVAGYAFNLVTCRCDIESGATVPPQHGLRRLSLYLPLDVDARDICTLKLSTFLFDGATIDPAVGVNGGSLNVNGGHLEVPGFKTWDARNMASWCLHFRCNGACAAGGLIGNGKDATNLGETVILGLTNANTIQANLYLWHPAGTRSLNANFVTPSNGWNHVCLTYDGNTVNLWVNGAVADTENVAGYLLVGHAPLAVGDDQALGMFNGHIDEVAVANFAFTAGEVNAHRLSDRAWMKSQGFWN